MARPRLSTTVLVTVAAFDLVTTIFWLRMGQKEGNPLFAYFASLGDVPFICAKVVYVAVPIGILEYARTKRPKSAEIGTWIAALVYIYLYASHLLQMRR